jgi:hypothetical protein
VDIDAAVDAASMLTALHERVERQFALYDAADGSPAEQHRAVRAIGTALATHDLPDAEASATTRRSSMVNGDRIRALRHAREIVSDMRWRGMSAPPLYISMAEEFQRLVRSGAYAAWVASQSSSRPRMRSGRLWSRAGSQQSMLTTPIWDDPATEAR